jgi:hypothetical protein
MTPARFVAFSVLLLAVIWLAVPLLADACDDDCGSHCGDCAWCPVSADLSSAGDDICMSSVDLRPGTDRRSQSVLPRALDHVPLLAN